MNLRQKSQLPPAEADAYLIWPRAGNTGDSLIASACERFLRDRGIEVWCSDGSFEEAAIAGDNEYLGAALARFRGMLMFSGGGNIGIYPDNGVMRAAIVAQAGPRHRCLVFSQSALRPEQALIDPRITIWCRDRVSFAIMKQAGARVELVPDMALYMDDRIGKHPGGSGTFFIKRTPNGDTETIEHNIDFDCMAEDLTLRNPLDYIIDTLKPYDAVISDRLHGALISLMMRKKTVLLPVGYHKNRAFFDTWLYSIAGAAFVERQIDLQPCMVALEPPTCDFKALFCRSADPALDRFFMGR